MAKTCLTKAQQVQKRNFDRGRQHEIFGVGDLVFVSSRLLRQQEKGERKLGHKWFGPFSISKRISDVAYVVDFPPSMRLHRTVNICFLRRCRVSSRYPRVLSQKGNSDSSHAAASTSG
ncbi:retrotransposon nucleocapsid related, partial [Cystoisospora suis]